MSAASPLCALQAASIGYTPYVATNGGMTAAGLVLSIIGLAICAAWLILFLAV